MSIRGIKLKYFVIGMSIFAILFGGWLTFFHSSGFVKTEATIVSMEETSESTADDKNYIVTVDYVVDGTLYTE